MGHSIIAMKLDSPVNFQTETVERTGNMFSVMAQTFSLSMYMQNTPC